MAGPGSALLRLGFQRTSTTLGVQQDVSQRALTASTLDVCFELEAVGDRTVKSGLVHRAMRGAVVGTEGGDVEVEGSGNLDVCVMEEGGEGSL